MKKYIDRIFLTLLFAGFTLYAQAQKVYTSGLVSVTMIMQGHPVEAKNYFTKDSAAVTFSAGPATVRVIADVNQQYSAVLIDVPAANMKKAAIATPAELEALLDSLPKFTFTPTSETKQISGFNCKKVQAKDSKSGQSYDIWITNDVSLPKTAIAKYYQEIGGFPVQYMVIQQGKAIQYTVTAISDQKVPAGEFSVPSDYEKITFDDLKAMQRGR